MIIQMSVWQYIRLFDHILPEIFINHNFQTIILSFKRQYREYTGEKKKLLQCLVPVSPAIQRLTA